MKQSLNDKEIRDILFDYYEFMGKRLRFFEELNIGKSRADAILIFNDRLTGFEIKSDVDSLERLPGQIKNYEKYCNENYLVVGTFFLDKVKELLPPSWGIYSCMQQESGCELVLVRVAQENKKVKLRNQLSLLWRKELIDIVKRHKLGGVTKRNRKKLAELIIDKLDTPVIMHEMCEELMEREWEM